MELLGLTIVVAGYFAYALISGRLEGLPITAPMVFVAFGFLLGPGGFDIAEINPGHGFLHVVAELTLIILLFSDAARIKLMQVLEDHNLPVRMLLIGLPLSIAFGALAGTLIFPEFSIWEAALLAALLAPTDAALGQAVVSNPAVPVRIRQAINIESGLNDGIALPPVLLFAALASAAGGSADATDWVTFGLMQVTLGPVVGVVVGYAGCRLLDGAVENHSVSEPFQGMGILALAGLCYLVAEVVGGNGFIAAFVGGLVFGNTVRNECDFLFEFMETEGTILMLITFLVFGVALLPEGLAGFEWRYLLFAALALTAIRMLPVGLSMIGSGIRMPTVAFLGWFGPRGLASILFLLVVIGEAEVPHTHEIFAVTVLTVALSTLLHGLTAAPFAAAYARMAGLVGKCVETETVIEIPLRSGMLEIDIEERKSV